MNPDQAMFLGLLGMLLLTLILWSPSYLFRKFVIKRPLSKVQAFLGATVIWIIGLLVCEMLLGKQNSGMHVAAIFAFYTLNT